MKFQFDSQQPHQLQAIKSIVRLFQHKPHQTAQHITSTHQTAQTLLLPQQYVPNPQLQQEELLKNLQQVQKDNNLPTSTKLSPSPSFTIEMETGTGKTYTYLRTIYELHTTYGFRKFIIIVPSIAIREGVIKNIQLTQQHFQQLYNAPNIRTTLYQSKKLSTLRHFATSHSLELLVMNIQAFNKKDNIINTKREQGFEPIEYLKITKPILILDEPQNMESDKSQAALNALQPLFTLRYSATHKTLHNLVYSLNPVQAYEQGLVKKIEVLDVLDKDNQNTPYIKLKAITATRHIIQAAIELHVASASGIHKKSRTIRNGANLYNVSGKLEAYRGYMLDRLDRQEGYIQFTNGKRLDIGTSIGGLNEEIMYRQMKETIEEHLKKETRLQGQGIKVLTLFFIDKVANYRQYTDKGIPTKGKYAKWFEEIYQELTRQQVYKPLAHAKVQEVHNGYFSKDNKGCFKDTKGESKNDLSTYELIMKEKERLLDLNEPLRFIFSHSALREGWDNPNIFQICTLHESTSHMKKRQEIGRGMRLAVDNHGNRTQGGEKDAINKLTLIVNESYETYAKALQKEIEEESGQAFDQNHIKHARKKKTCILKKGFQADPKFLAIWNKIKRKTRYNVSYSTDELIEQAGANLNETLSHIHGPKLQIQKATFNITHKEGVQADVVSDRQATYQKRHHYALPNILHALVHATKLTYKTLATILLRSQQVDKFLLNPQKALTTSIKTINTTLQGAKLQHIQYQKKYGSTYEMSIFDEELSSYIQSHIHDNLNTDKTIYQQGIPLDSEVESEFAKHCNTVEQVLFYFKLPPKFKIPTPIGNYNPDWAVIWQHERGTLNDKAVYFVAETKGRKDDLNLRGGEQVKITCGKKHFQALANGINFTVASTYKDFSEQVNSTQANKHT